MQLLSSVTSMSSYFSTIETLAKGAATAAVGLTSIGVGLLYYGQNYLIYPSAFPEGARTQVPKPSDFGLKHVDLDLTTPDNVLLKCYLLLQDKDIGHVRAGSVAYDSDFSDEEFRTNRPTVIMFHGNGGNVGHRVPIAKVFYVSMRCNVLMMSYRGYGLSEGSPSEKGFMIDAQTALDYVLGHPELSKSPIILYGQSIGGAVSIDLASRNPSAIRGLILENTFCNLPSLIPTTLPLLSPFQFLCHQKWDSLSKIPLIPRATPILMLSGLRDEIVPPEQMQELWKEVGKRQGKAVGSGEKGHLSGEGLSKFIEYPRGTHNDTCVQDGYWTAVAEFIASLGRANTNQQKPML